MTDQTAATECAFADEGCTCGRPRLTLTEAQARMAATPKPGPTFATYLDRHDRDQLDARAAAAEGERDDAQDDLTEARAKLAIVIRERDGLHADLDAFAADLRDAAGVLAATETERNQARAELAQARQVAGIATDVLATIRDAAERIDRALAVYDTTPEEPAEREDAPHEDPSRLREQLAEAHADCARYATERDEAQRLLNQTAAALNVALHHANDNTSYAPWTDHYKQRAAELDGCRIALQEATEATTAAPSSVPPRRVQEEPPYAAAEAAMEAVVARLTPCATEPHGDLRMGPKRAALMAVDAAAPILLAAGRRQAAAAIREKIAGLPFNAARPYMEGLVDAADIAEARP